MGRSINMKIKLSELDLPVHDLRASVDEDALDELAASFRDHGQQTPISVFKKRDGRYEVIFGSRRTRAARLNKWDEIEAIVNDEPDEQTRAASKLIENVQRLEMTPMEEAYGIASLIGEGEADIRFLQRQTGKSRSWLLTRIALIDLPEDLQGALQAGVISMGVAREFGSIKNSDVRELYIKAAAENGCTAYQARIWANQAQFAESGIMTMEQIQKNGIDLKSEPVAQDQHYHCFICATLTNWRRINALMICGTCQDTIGEARTGSPTPLAPYPLDERER
jgi:ParB/RepB/Spo0J family partition protein